MTLAVSDAALAQSSVWDRPLRPVQPAAATQSVATPQYDWGDIRADWTSTDASRRQRQTVASPVATAQPPVVQAAPAPARPAGDVGAFSIRQVDWQADTSPPAQPPRNATSSAAALRFPAPESIIRSGLASSQGEPLTAASVLRGAAPRTPAPPPAGSGLWSQEVVHADTSSDWSATRDLRPFPPDQIRQAATIEEPAYSLFDHPPNYHTEWERERDIRQPYGSDFHLTQTQLQGGQAGPGGYSLQGGFQSQDRYAEARQPLIAAPAPPYDPRPWPEAATSAEPVANLDGLDGIAKPYSPGQVPYRPAPMNEIRPTRDYRSEQVTLCPDPNGRCPEILPLPETLERYERDFAHLDYYWAPSNVFYNPLYFEDPSLERNGHTWGPLLQPFASVTRASLQLAFLPYQMTLDPPCRRVYPLGFYEPGDCAPKLIPAVPLNARAGAVMGATWTGAAFIFP